MEDALHTAIEALERAIQSREIELTGMKRSLQQLQGTAPGFQPKPKSTEWAELGITEAAQNWLAEVGGFKATREIADAIRDRGVQTSSRNYTATVYATLANATSKFVRKDGLWGLKKPK